MNERVKDFSREIAQLLDWYARQGRHLPWRGSKNPYQIWISEVMLQQTTVAAVKPYFERFLESFPNVKSLAEAPLDQVLAHWSGLGYYSRARNLHRSSQVLALRGFPKSHLELLDLPGFGPYTARAVSSLAFEEPVGVLDGNVIRVLSRYFGLKLKWWTSSGRLRLQTLVDQMAAAGVSSQVNQALMDLGATLCIPKGPRCALCPWVRACKARRLGIEKSLPLSKPRKPKEYWLWQPQIHTRSGQVLLVENDYAPFLKGHWIFPGLAKRLKKPQKTYHLKHSITHHHIGVKLPKKSADRAKDGNWVPWHELERYSPSSLMQKVKKMVLVLGSKN